MESSFDIGDFAVDILVSKSGDGVDSYEERYCFIDEDALALKKSGYEGYIIGNGYVGEGDYQVSMGENIDFNVDGVIAINVGIQNFSDEPVELELGQLADYRDGNVVAANDRLSSYVYIPMDEITDTNGVYTCNIPVTLKNINGDKVYSEEIVGALSFETAKKIKENTVKTTKTEMPDIHESNEYIELNVTNYVVLETEDGSKIYSADLEMKNLSANELYVSGSVAGSYFDLAGGATYKNNISGFVFNGEQDYIYFTVKDKSQLEGIGKFEYPPNCDYYEFDGWVYWAYEYKEVFKYPKSNMEW